MTALQLLDIWGNDRLSQLPSLDSLTALQLLRIAENNNLTQLPSLQSLPNLAIVATNQQQDLTDLKLYQLASLKKIFLPDNEIGKNFAKLFQQQRQQQKLNAVQIEFLSTSYSFDIDSENELKKLKQP